MKKYLGLITILTLFIILSGCSGPSNTEGIKENNLVRLGITGGESEVWSYIRDKLLEEGIQLEIVSFSDYTRPNIALEEGEIDINAFQHYAFFSKFREEHNLNLEVVGETVIAPLGIYSNKIQSIDEIHENAKIAIPNDITNGSRALKLLETANLIKLNNNTELPTRSDIVSNPFNLEIIEVDASNTPRALEDVLVATINSGVAVDAGFLPTEDSIYLEPINESSKPYINIIVARAGEEDNPYYKRILEIYQTEEVESIINEIYKGAQVKAW